MTIFNVFWLYTYRQSDTEVVILITYAIIYHMMMHNLKVISLNVDGINVSEKRRVLVSLMRRNEGEIVLIQETHFRKEP